MQKGQYPESFFRVSVKAVIENDKGEILVVQEGEDWTLPGGGIDHGEDPITALKRELYEEARIQADFEMTLVGTESFYVEHKDAFAFWLIYRLKIDTQNLTFEAGEDADDVAFRDPVDFKDSGSIFEQAIYKYGEDMTVEISPHYTSGRE